MTHPFVGVLKIVIYLVLGKMLYHFRIVQDRELATIKSIALTIVVPSVLFLSFSMLSLQVNHIPVTLVVIGINCLLFMFGVLLFRLGGRKNRVLPLYLCSMNFSLVGIPLYESVFGLEHLHHYVLLGVGSEIFFWFLFFPLFSRTLTKESSSDSPISGLLRSPIVWAILLGCLVSLLGIELANSSHIVVQALYSSVEGLGALASPLILIYIGCLLSIDKTVVKKSLSLIILRLACMFPLGYLLKFLVVDHYIPPNTYANAAFFLLLSLPAVFSLPIIAENYLNKTEVKILGNMIVMHIPITVVLFSVYTWLV